MTVPATTSPATPAPSATPVASDVLHNEHHSRLTTADIAKAVARHKREHPNQIAPPTVSKNRPVPPKTTPRG